MDELTRKQRVLAYVRSLYVPVGKRKSYDELVSWLEYYGNIASITKNDAYKTRYLILVIETKGHAPRASFSSWCIYRGDIFEVTDRSADVYLITGNDEKGVAKRISILTCQYSIVL